MSAIAVLGGSPWISALGWTLLHFLWQGTVVGIVFAMVRKAIPTQHCNARYLNGLLTLLALAVLPVVTFFRLLERPLGSVDALASADRPWSMAVSVPGVETATGSFDSFLSWIVVVWFAGVVLVGVRSWREWRELIKVAQHWATPDARLQEIITALASRFGFARNILVLVSDRIDTPTLIGWIKPLILLPTGVALGFPRQQIELILAHELGHLRRYDHLVNLFQALLEIVLFYHPVVHWVAREIRNEREICCDELVLRVTKGDPREYAGALAALEELRQPPMRLALAASGGVLLERVRRILFAPHSETTRFGIRLWLPLLLVIVVVMAAAVSVDERNEPVYVDMPLPRAAAMPGPAIVLVVPSSWVENLKAELSLDPLPEISLAQIAGSVPATKVDPERPADSESSADMEQASSAPTAILSAPSVVADVPGMVNSVSVAQADDSAREAGSDIAETFTPTARGRAVPTHIVAPRYPASFSQSDSARVGLSFTIAANGNVRNIAVDEDSTADVSFVRAATRALRQWRFRPVSVAANTGARYVQDFVFAPQVSATSADDRCVRHTGSRLCHRIETDSAAAIQPMALAPQAPATNVGDSCVRLTGSRLCYRSENDATPAMQPMIIEKRGI